MINIHSTISRVVCVLPDHPEYVCNNASIITNQLGPNRDHEPDKGCGMLMTQWAVAGKGKSKTETDLRIVRIVTIHGKGKWGGPQ